MNDQPTGLMLSDDLLFISRVTGTADTLGLHVRAMRSSADLLAQAVQTHPPCVLLDLDHPGLDVAEVVRRLKQEPLVLPFIVGYGPHVDTESLRAARAAGCDLVLPRSKFVEVLPRDLPRWFAAGDGA